MRSADSGNLVFDCNVCLQTVCFYENDVVRHTILLLSCRIYGISLVFILLNTIVIAIARDGELNGLGLVLRSLKIQRKISIAWITLQLFVTTVICAYTHTHTHAFTVVVIKK